MPQVAAKLEKHANATSSATRALADNLQRTLAAQTEARVADAEAVSAEAAAEASDARQRVNSLEGAVAAGRSESAAALQAVRADVAGRATLADLDGYLPRAEVLFGYYHEVVVDCCCTGAENDAGPASGARGRRWAGDARRLGWLSAESGGTALLSLWRYCFIVVAAVQKVVLLQDRRY